MKRNASHAGSWYSGDPSTLSRQLDGWLDKTPSRQEDIRAVIAPHAGFRFSGPTAAYAYKSVNAPTIQRVFILGPSHHVYLDGCALTQCSDYETPLGNLPVDAAINAQLRQTGRFTLMDSQTDEDEHSIEMHLPFIRHVFKHSVTVVPILVGSISPTKEKLFGSILAPFLADKANLFVVSSDFCHWGQRFNFTTHSDFSMDIHESIELLDREAMTHIETRRPEAFEAYLNKTRNTICGRHPISVLMYAMNDQHRIQFVHYSQSNKVESQRDSSVSYAAAIIKLKQ